MAGCNNGNLGFVFPHCTDSFDDRDGTGYMEDGGGKFVKVVESFFRGKGMVDINESDYVVYVILIYKQPCVCRFFEFAEKLCGINIDTDRMY